MSVDRIYDVLLRFWRSAADVPAAPVGQISLEVVGEIGEPELRMVDEDGVAWPVGSSSGSGNIDGGTPSSTYDTIDSVDGGSP